MIHQTKIATCCYCGRRTTLQLTARSGHELACGACGAPLHEMKLLRSAPRTPKQKHVPADVASLDLKRAKPKKQKRKKSPWKKAFGEVFDVLEDIFD